MTKTRITPILYGVSAGPGDPELLTRKAQRVLISCAVIAAPVAPGGNTLALDIVKAAVDLEGKEILRLPFHMKADESLLAETYRAHAGAIIAQLEAGRDVAMVSLGDVSVYSTFAPIGELVRTAGYRVEMIPGVTSFCASACALGIGLTAMREPLHVFPASFSNMENALACEGTKVFMKSAGAFAGVRRAAMASGQAACAAVDCGLQTQALYGDLNDMPDNPGYFTTVIVKDHGNTHESRLDGTQYISAGGESFTG